MDLNVVKMYLLIYISKKKKKKTLNVVFKQVFRKKNRTQKVEFFKMTTKQTCKTD